jgi:hypothetical protein
LSFPRLCVAEALSEGGTCLAVALAEAEPVSL